MIITDDTKLPVLCNAYAGVGGWSERYRDMAQPILIMKLVLHDKKPTPEDTWYTGTILESDGTFRTEEFQSVHGNFHALRVVEE